MAKKWSVLAESASTDFGPHFPTLNDKKKHTHKNQEQTEIDIPLSMVPLLAAWFSVAVGFDGVSDPMIDLTF